MGSPSLLPLPVTPATTSSLLGVNGIRPCFFLANECSAPNTRKTVFPQREQNPPFCLLVSLVHSRRAPEHLAGDTCPATSSWTTCLFDKWPRVGGVGVGISEADFFCLDPERCVTSSRQQSWPKPPGVSELQKMCCSWCQGLQQVQLLCSLGEWAML